MNETSLTCSTDVGSGSYSNPVSVSVTCSTSSEITYCVGPGGVCCDPSSGSVYSGPIPIGATNGNYCLKFSATAVNGKTASGQKDYVITVSLPELTVTTEKIQYQTTELPGLMSISSNNFGYASHSMGVINLKGHDPGASGLNMSCEDIVVNHGTLSSPTPSVPMAEASITGIPANTQIDAMIGIDDLVYGTNYITNYVVNYQEAVPLYACSTVEKKIWDFTYFDHMPSHGDPGSNTVREFAGSFTHLGFFEPAATVYRGPAGETTSTDASDELQVGLFGVVY